MSNQPLPLPNFAGHLDLRPVRGLPSTWNLDCLLSVNPTRFVRHQEFPIPASRMLNEIHTFDYSFDRANVSPVHGNEWALVDADNWIPDDRLWSMFASPRFWGRHLRSYLNGVVSQIQNDIARAASIADVTIRPVQGNAFSLQTVETYWEFFADDAPSVVSRLEPLLQRYAASPVDVRDYQGTVRVDSPGNSRRLTLRTRVGEHLTIYAKTSRRIRFEVEYKLNGDEPFRGLEGGHTFPSIEGVRSLLHRLSGTAADRVNSVLRHFRLHASAATENHTVLKLIHDVQAAVGNHDRALQLLQLLVSNDALVVGAGTQLGTVFRDELRRLARREILQVSNRRYSVPPPYRQALNNMRRTGIGFMLGVRDRRR